MKAIVAALLLMLGFAIGSPGVRADHESRYDFDKTVTLTGVLRAVSWQNPRVFLTFEIPGPDMQVERWSAMTGNPAQLGRAGITDRKQLVIGERYEIEVNPARGKEKAIFIKSLKFPDGRVVNLGM